MLHSVSETIRTPLPCRTNTSSPMRSMRSNANARSSSGSRMRASPPAPWGRTSPAVGTVRLPGSTVNPYVSFSRVQVDPPAEQHVGVVLRAPRDTGDALQLRLFAEQPVGRRLRILTGL